MFDRYNTILFPASLFLHLFFCLSNLLLQPLRISHLAQGSFLRLHIQISRDQKPLYEFAHKWTKDGWNERAENGLQGCNLHQSCCSTFFYKKDQMKKERMARKREISFQSCPFFSSLVSSCKSGMESDTR